VLELYDHQKAMQEPMRERKNALLLAPCGSGKTLAVVYSWLKERPTKHLIYILPTTTLLKSIKQDIIELIEGKEGKPNAVKELGYRIVDLEQTRFSDPKLISIATDYGEERESKLYAHDIIITTMDSYIARLYRSSLTPKKFRDLPIARIFNSTTIFDEAQMYDNYTHTLARYTFKLLREGKAHHIVMTATLSDKMIEFLELKDEKDYKKIPVPDDKWMSFTGKKQIAKIVEFNDFASKVEEIVNENKISRALIVCNTVGKAQDLFKKLSSGARNVLLLHSRFKHEDREKKENQIREHFTKDNSFIVATQVVEAGIDISAPCLITEIATGDSLVQRIGRCARRKNEEGSIFLLYSKEEKPLPYKKSEIEPVIQMLKGLQGNQNYNFALEKQLVESVIPPALEGNAESKARGIILSAFVSLSAFGDAWINVPTRDATPVYIYFGKNINKDDNNKVMENCVRVDLRFLYSISKDLSEFKFYDREYDKEDQKITFTARKNPNAWSIAVSKSVEYDPILGVMKI
jgi:CRISPR-associated endonuclease/helicase Cas3